MGKGEVVGIDIDIREHNKKKIENHPMYKRITMIEGSSTAKEIVEQVKALAKDKKNIMVVLDSNHTHDHVLKEMELFAPLVSKGSYLVVFDTIIEDLPTEFFKDRLWDVGNNPKTAVQEFLKTTDKFIIDEDIENKALITVAPSGFLRRIE